MIYTNDTDTDTEQSEEEEEVDDEDATLADDVLDEVDSESSGDEVEGFGHDDTEDEAAPAATEPEPEPEEDSAEDGSSLEEDAEEVDFDRFDDVDEM